ncbi:Macrolide export ATP-binding/permease protein MacB [Pseudobythopirellula maris]|uniref:Macrolide export ATP-binding/permease protein MacB n=1 Tax=Pseudobythopirellula maris TaxID=2527991 RepID=A0A5C5ZUH7_9BACT|nr:ABC transporter permease [Pseudobythopirellula maris]TWT89843.1 Macrolide export ATP-binding/permease protein MacB [Pseudobythopirellula maris]
MIPVRYSSRNLMVRWRTTLTTAGGFTLVVAALILMLAFVNGIRTVNAVTGHPQNILVMQEGNSDEVLSRLDYSLAVRVEGTPGVARDAARQPLASREMFMVMQPRAEENQPTGFLQVRGCGPNAYLVHDGVRIVRGRNFHANTNEAVIGESLSREQGVRVGQMLALGSKEWRVVGVFNAGGSTFESEVWCDLDQLAAQFNRHGAYTSVVLRMESVAAVAPGIKHLLESRLTPVEAIRERDYFQAQAEQTEMITAAALVIAMFMAVGTVFGVTNTMFAALGQRTKDIAVLRLMGYRQGEILVAFLLEALLIAAVGGVVGLMLGSLINGMTLSATMGSKTLAFAFRVDAAIMATALGFTLVMGLLGGLFPAVSAMRVQPLEALR